MSMTVGELDDVNELIKKMTTAIKAQQIILLDALEVLQKYSNGLLEDVKQQRDAAQKEVDNE